MRLPCLINGRVKYNERCGFAQITSQPLPDPQEGGATYIIMAKSVALSRC